MYEEIFQFEFFHSIKWSLNFLQKARIHTFDHFWAKIQIVWCLQYFLFWWQSFKEKNNIFLYILSFVNCPNSSHLSCSWFIKEFVLNRINMNNHFLKKRSVASNFAFRCYWKRNMVCRHGPISCQIFIREVRIIFPKKANQKFKKSKKSNKNSSHNFENLV